MMQMQSRQKFSRVDSQVENGVDVLNHLQGHEVVRIQGDGGAFGEEIIYQTLMSKLSQIM